MIDPLDVGRIIYEEQLRNTDMADEAGLAIFAQRIRQRLPVGWSVKVHLERHPIDDRLQIVVDVRPCVPIQKLELVLKI